MDDDLQWVVCSYDELSKEDLYAIFKLRVDVFVVEQNCPYNEIDGQDSLKSTVHYLGKLDGKLCCYARRLGPEKVGESTRIGRVVVEASHRGKGIASVLLKKIIAEIRREDAGQFISLSAQTAALKLYSNLGFVEVSDSYLDDGIPHVDMSLSLK
jgi:ElaA protein